MINLLPRNHVFILILLHVVFATFSKAQLVSPTNHTSKLKEDCKKHRSECNSYLISKNLLRSRESCQNCVTVCSSEPLTNDEISKGHSAYCLYNCALNDCARGNRGVKLNDFFSCEYVGNRCWHAWDGRKPEFPGRCSKCAEICKTINEQDANWCQSRCGEQGCTSFQSPSPSSEPPSSEKNPPIVSDDPVSNNETNTKPNSLESAGQKHDIWTWLGPVLGAIATIVGAVITVVWVRDSKSTRSRCSICLPNWIGHTDNEMYLTENKFTNSLNSLDQIGQPPKLNVSSITANQY